MQKVLFYIFSIKRLVHHLYYPEKVRTRHHLCCCYCSCSATFHRRLSLGPFVIKLDLRNPFNLTYPEYLMSGLKVEAYNRSCLTGHIDTSLLQLQHLQYLDLSVNNFLQIPIPAFFGNLTQLKYLNLAHASFAGIVPHQLGYLRNLEYLDLFPYSYLIPFPEIIWVSEATWLSGLSSLKYLNLGNANLSLISTA